MRKYGTGLLIFSPIILIGIISILFGIGFVRRAYMVLREPIMGEAKVISIEEISFFCPRRKPCYDINYSFVTPDGKTFFGVKYGETRMKEKKYMPGDKLTIQYYKDNPRFNSAGSANNVASEYFLGGLCLVIGIMMLAFIKVNVFDISNRKYLRKNIRS